MSFDILVDDVSGQAGRDRLVDCLSVDGFVVLKDGLADARVARVLAGLERLFGLPADEKLRWRAPRPLAPGFIPFGHQADRQSGAVTMLESWDFCPDEPAVFPETMYDVWCDVSALHHLLFERALGLLEIIESALRLPAARLRRLVDGQSCSMQLLHYPAELLGSVDHGRRQSPHKDASVLTLLPTASGPGLLVRQAGRWRPLEISERDVVVMAGYALEYVTAGRLTACCHTVTTPRAADGTPARFSMPFFASPRADGRLAPVGGGDDQAYPAVSREEFMETHFPTEFY